MLRSAILLTIAACAAAADAAVVPISPIGGENVVMLPEGQIDVIALSTYSNRVERLKKKWIGKADTEKQWGRTRPLVLRWRVTGGEQGPWKIEIGKKEDLSDARVWLVADQKPRLRGEKDKDIFGLKLTDANLEVGGVLLLARLEQRQVHPRGLMRFNAFRSMHVRTRQGRLRIVRRDIHHRRPAAALDRA